MSSTIIWPYKAKKYFYTVFLFLFLSPHLVDASCTVCSDVPTGETIWNLVSTIYATREISTTINNLSLPFTITTPGIYSICENLTWTGAGAAITINTGNSLDPVILNMAGHRIDITAGGNGIVGVGTSIFTVYNGTIATSGGATAATLISGAIDVTSVDFACAISGNTNSGIVIPGASVIPNLIPRITDCTFRNIASAIAAATTSLQIRDCIISGSALNAIQITTATGILELFNSTIEDIGSSCVNFAGVLGSGALCVINNCVLQNVSTTLPAIVVTGASFNMDTTAIRTPVGITASGTFGTVDGTTAHIANSTVTAMSVANTTGLVLSDYDVATVADSFVQDATSTNIGGISISAGDSATITNCSLNALTGQAWFINACNNAVVSNCVFAPTEGTLLTTNAAAVFSTENVLVQDCIISNAQVTGASILQIHAPATGFLQAIVRDCALLDCSNTSTTAALLAINSTSTVSAAYIEGCQLLNVSTTGGGIVTQSIGNIVIRNCSIQNYNSPGIASAALVITSSNNALVEECSAEDVSNCTAMIAATCGSVSFDKCIVQNMQNGFNAIAAGSCTSVIFTNCTIKNVTVNGPVGTLIDVLGSSGTLYVIIDGCTVTDAVLANASPIHSSQVFKGIIRNCLIQNILITDGINLNNALGIDGFGLGSLSSGIIENCTVNNVNNSFAAIIGLANLQDGTARNCTIEKSVAIQGIFINAVRGLALSNIIFDLNCTTAIAGAAFAFNNLISHLTSGTPYSPATGLGGTVISVATSGGTLPATTGYWANIAP